MHHHHRCHQPSSSCRFDCWVENRGRCSRGRSSWCPHSTASPWRATRNTEAKYEAKQGERKMKRTADAANHGTTYWWWLPWLCVPLGSVQLRWQVPDFRWWLHLTLWLQNIRMKKYESKYEAKQDEENSWICQSWYYLPVVAAMALYAIRVSPVEIADTRFWNLDHDDMRQSLKRSKVKGRWREWLMLPSMALPDSSGCRGSVCL